MLTDLDIMVRVQAGETRLFAELVQRYQEKLRRFAASKLGSKTEAEDLVQDAFLAVFHARHSYSPQFAFSTWIWTITLNLTRRALRQQSRRIRTLEQYQAVHSLEETTVQGVVALLQIEQSEQLNHWLSMLPEQQGDAIRLRYLGGLPYEEIALAMDCSLSGAKRRVKVGVLKLAELAREEA